MFTPDLKEARKRSVDNLQRLYTVVVSLAVTEGLKRLLGPSATAVKASDWLMLASLIVTLIPFYHGANRYLDATYVTGERSAKNPALLIDFVLLFLEGVAFFALAMAIGAEQMFYSILSALLVFDILWVGMTNLTATGADDKMNDYISWALINAFAAALLLLFVWSNLMSLPFWSTPLARSVSLFAVALARTILDYKRVWRFYYPSESLTIPAPAPAPLPAQETVQAK